MRFMTHDHGVFSAQGFAAEELSMLSNSCTVFGMVESKGRCKPPRMQEERSNFASFHWWPVRGMCYNQCRLLLD